MSRFAVPLALLVLTAAVSLGTTRTPAAAQSVFDFASEEEEVGPGPVRWQGLLDVRYVRTSERRSWLYQPATLHAVRNKLRYGGKDTDADDIGDSEATLFAVPQASLVLEAGRTEAVQAHLQLNVDADLETGDGSLDVIEAFAEAERALANVAVHLRLGAFIPPLSFEHPDVAWSTRYSLTPSTIGSWVGEDLRAVGGEMTVQWAFSPDHVTSLSGGLFSGSDQSGRVLLERGWALHDYQPGLDFAYTLAIDTEEELSRWQPFQELDGNLGYYALADLHLYGRMIEARAGIWDNRADKTAAGLGSGGDVYDTRFLHAGVKATPYPQATVIVQIVDGETEHATADPLNRKEYRAFYALGSYEWKRLTGTVRYDDYEVTNLEEGNAVTAALSWRVGLRNRITLEYVTYESDRKDAGHPDVVIPVPEKLEDDLLSLNARFYFGQ